METFAGCLDNGSPPWADYRAFIPGRLIALDKQASMQPVAVGGTGRHLFSKIVIKKQPWHDRMTSCVLELRRKFTARSKEFNIFGTKT